jgi:hypothetical protein
VVAARKAAVDEKLTGLLARLFLLTLHLREAEDRAEDPRIQPAVHPDEHVLHRGHLLKSLMFWNVRPIPSFVIVCGGRYETSVPSNRIDPEVGL